MPPGFDPMQATRSGFVCAVCILLIALCTQLDAISLEGRINFDGASLTFGVL